MTSLRVAVLVFLVGSSLANLLALKERLDWIGPERVVTTTTGGIQWDALVDRDRRRTDQYDRAWMREAIIVTVAGVAWFLIRPKQTSP